MIKYLLSIIILVFSVISCENGSNHNDKNTVKNKAEVVVDKNPTVIRYEYDSLVIQKTENIGSYSYDLTDSFYVLSANSISKIKPFITDSIIKDYSCCPEYVTGFLTAYSDGKMFRRFSITERGGAFGKNEIDSGYAFIVPHSYQYRIRVPIDFWKKILIDCNKIKVETKNKP